VHEGPQNTAIPPEYFIVGCRAKPSAEQAKKIFHLNEGFKPRTNRCVVSLINRAAL